MRPDQKIKKILVTGGCGFIGKHTVRLLLLEGYKVHVLDDLSNSTVENLADMIEESSVEKNDALTFQKGSTLNFADLEEALAEADAVMHLAAQVSVPASIENPLNSLHPNVVGFNNLMEVARQKKAKSGVGPKIVYASSAAVYGATTEVCSEENVPEKPLSPYAADKQTNELYAQLYESLYGLETLGLRYFNVYGQGQDPKSPYSGVISKFVDLIEEGNPLTIFGDGRQSRDFIAVKDVVQANFQALLSDVTGVLNIATGQSVTINQLIQTMETVIDNRVAKQEKPPREGDIEHSSANVTRAASLLNFTAQTPLEEGLRPLFTPNIGQKAAL